MQTSNEDDTPPFVSKVMDDQDLLIEILVRLPVKSILQFKTVSKDWYSHIVDPSFACRLKPTVSGLFLHSSCRNAKIGFVSVDNYNDHPPSFTLFPGLLDVRILNSCNGLLCCHALIENEQREVDVVLNPTTKQFCALPQPHLPYIQDMCLVFDPSQSLNYKVVCITYTVYGMDSFYNIEVYSSETGSWKICGEPILTEDYTQFQGGVYWNGAVNWFSTREDSLYFHVEEERLEVMPMLPLSNGYSREFRHFGESRGHLHLVEIYGRTTKFYIYEMNRDYSGWFVKYRVDLGQVGSTFPEMMHTHPLERRHRVDFESYSFDILSIIRGEREEESFMVLQVPGKIINYNLEKKTFKIMSDFPSGSTIEFSSRNFWFADYYIKSLWEV